MVLRPWSGHVGPDAGGLQLGTRRAARGARRAGGTEQISNKQAKSRNAGISFMISGYDADFKQEGLAMKLIDRLDMIKAYYDKQPDGSDAAESACYDWGIATAQTYTALREIALAAVELSEEIERERGTWPWDARNVGRDKDMSSNHRRLVVALKAADE